MTIQEIANRLVQLCREGKYEQVQDELYSPNAISVEPDKAPPPQSVEGLQAIREKTAKFRSMLEAAHGGYVTEPVIAGNHFSIGMGMDVTMKGIGRMNLEEIVVYEVADRKIVKEQFFF
jgi:hypothetical protein